MLAYSLIAPALNPHPAKPLTLYRPGPNQSSDPVQFLGGCFRGRPKTTRKKIIRNFRLLVAETRFGHKCPARKSHGCPARRTCILKFANFYATRNLTGQLPICAGTKLLRCHLFRVVLGRLRKHPPKN